MISIPSLWPKSVRFQSCAALACAGVFAAGSLPTAAQAAPVRRRAAKSRPAKKVTAATTLLTPALSGRAATPVQTLLVRSDLPAMGTNNAVRLWVRGDGSGADLRVRVLAPSRASSPAAEALPRDTWISSPVPVTFQGWREVVLPQSKFTLRAAAPLPANLDLALPADAQPAAAEMPAATPDWASATGLALDVSTSKQAMLVVDDIAWVTLDEAGKGTATTLVTDFETGNVGAWKPVGDAAETASLTYGVTTQADMVHGGRVAFRFTVTPPGLARQAAVAAGRQVMAATGKSYLFWTPASLFEPILPTSLPPLVGTSNQITLSACAEQTQAASFCLYSPKALSYVIVSLPSDLQGIGNIIPSSKVEIHVVKVLPQSGSGSLRDPDTAGLAPSLLVKDDRTVLSGLAPALRLTGPAVCDIPADTAKQFWITVSVPRNTPSNNYIGKVFVSGKGLAPFSIRLVLSVLPLRLLAPAKQYGIDLRSRLDPAPATLPSSDGRQLATDFVAKDTLDAQLADIAAHGFTIASLYDSSATLWDAISEYKAYGLGTPYNLYKGDADPKDVEAGRAAHGSPALTYYTDPIPNDAALTHLGPLTKAGLPSASYVPHQGDYDALQADLDTVVYGRDSEYAQQLLRTKGARVSAKRDWWYWPASSEDPTINRADSGFLLWRSNLYGAFLPDYQTPFGADPYDETSLGASPSKAAYRPLMLTYPVKGGVLDTLQWEACREGVSDVRYLTTMYAALRECKDAHIASPLVTEAETYVKTFLDKPLANLPGDQLDTFRLQVANYAMLLRKSVDTYNKAHGLI